MNTASRDGCLLFILTSYPLFEADIRIRNGYASNKHVLSLIRESIGSYTLEATCRDAGMYRTDVAYTRLSAAICAHIRQHTPRSKA